MCINSSVPACQESNNSHITIIFLCVTVESGTSRTVRMACEPEKKERELHFDPKESQMSFIQTSCSERSRDRAKMAFTAERSTSSVKMFLEKGVESILRDIFFKGSSVKQLTKRVAIFSWKRSH